MDDVIKDRERAMLELDAVFSQLQEGVESVQLHNVFEFLKVNRPFKQMFDSVGDRFALMGVRSLKEATYAILKEEVKEEYVVEELRKEGLKKIFVSDDRLTGLRRRVQDIWVFTLRNFPMK